MGMAQELLFSFRANRMQLIMFKLDELNLSNSGLCKTNLESVKWLPLLSIQSIKSSFLYLIDLIEQSKYLTLQKNCIDYIYSIIEELQNERVYQQFHLSVDSSLPTMNKSPLKSN